LKDRVETDGQTDKGIISRANAVDQNTAKFTNNQKRTMIN